MDDEARVRIEKDTMGEVAVPAGALYGAQTQRALEDFPISGRRMPRAFLRALGLIKLAAAKANRQLGTLPAATATAIQDAAREIAEGRYDDQFVVDIFQSGSGTSTNMNANEVIAHVASARKGAAIHPNDEVNRSQSSNDVIPTAIHVSAVLLVREQLLPTLALLEKGLAEKAAEFADVVKIGRTHLQDAVPMWLGQEFGGYAQQVKYGAHRIRTAADGMLELALGGTAIGTGLNAPKDFARIAIAELSASTGIPFREAENHFEAQAAKDAVCFLSGALRCLAVALMKIANDIRWLGSGPQCGLRELRLPELLPGSSIMPGKVNPVIPESTWLVCAQVIGLDATIALCCASGNFELNATMPLIASNLIESIELLSAASQNLQQRCVRGLEANRERTTEYAESSLANVTMLVPEIGYERAAAIAKEAFRSGRSLHNVAREQSGIAEDALKRLLDPRRQAG